MRKMIVPFLFVTSSGLSQAFADMSTMQEAVFQGLYGNFGQSTRPVGGTGAYPKEGLAFLETAFANMVDANFLTFLEQSKLFDYSNYEFPEYFRTLYDDTEKFAPLAGVLTQVPATQDPRFRGALRAVTYYSVLNKGDVYTAGLERLKVNLLKEFTKRRDSIMQNSALRLQAYRLIGNVATNGIVVTTEQGPWVYKMLPNLNTKERQWLNADEIEALMQAAIQSRSIALHDYFLSLSVSNPRIQALQKLSGKEEWLTLGTTAAELSAINEVMTRYETAVPKGERDLVKIYHDLREYFIIHNGALSETMLTRMLETAAKAPNINGTSQLFIFSSELFSRMPTERFQHWLPILVARADQQTRSMLIPLMNTRIRFFYEKISGSQFYDIGNTTANIETFKSQNLGGQALKEIRMLVDLHAALNEPLENQSKLSGSRAHIRKLISVLPAEVLSSPEARAIVSTHGSLWAKAKNFINQAFCEKALSR